jgi:drug/metabolite transporter (DMT)-like permease
VILHSEDHSVLDNIDVVQLAGCSVMQPEPSRAATTRAVFLMLASGLAVGFLPNMTKLALVNGADPPSVLFARTGVILFVLAAYIKATGGKLLIPKHLLGAASVAGLSAAFQNYTAVSAMNHISISLMMLIIFAHPFLVALYYHLDGTTKLTPYRLFWSLLAFAGVGLAISVDFGHLSTLGLLLSGASAVLCAVLVVSMVSLGKEVGALTATFQLSIWTLGLGAVAMGVSGKVQMPINLVGWMGATAAGVAVVLAYVLFLEAARLIGGSRATILSFLEPIFAVLVAAVMFDERLSGLQWIGVLMVAASLAMLEAPTLWSKQSVGSNSAR